jgi:hypothetical protein
VAEITSASAEQSDGIQRVGDAVSQIDHATQQNTALVEEGAAAAESLKGRRSSWYRRCWSSSCRRKMQGWRRLRSQGRDPSAAARIAPRTLCARHSRPPRRPQRNRSRRRLLPRPGPAPRTGIPSRGSTRARRSPRVCIARQTAGTVC